MNTETGNGFEELMTPLGVSRMLGALPAQNDLPTQQRLKLSGGEDVRMDKVMAIQTALASGSYDVPARAVAEKMLDAMLTLERERLQRERRRRPRAGHRGLMRRTRSNDGF